MEQAVEFCGAQGPVYGIMHGPSRLDGRRWKTGVVFINAGVRSRRGPKRLYVRFARRLCRAGYHVLRFDLPGIGDSPGEVENVSAYKRQFIDGTESAARAIDYFKETTGVERVGMVGMCGGAYSAMMATTAESRVDFLMLASLPVQELGDFSREAVIDIVTQDYFRNALTWRSWYKLLTGKSKYRLLARAMLKLVRGRYRRPRLNRALWQACAELLSEGRKILFVYGSQDPLYRPFADAFQKQLHALDRLAACYDVHVVRDGNHTFSQIRWQDELIDRSISWLGRLSDQTGDGPAGPSTTHDKTEAELAL